MFDFTNYTYSGLLSLVSAVFGISYPLILDSIARLDDKYGGTIITQGFLHEKRYRIFRWLLIINLIMAVTVPFVLYVYSDNHALLVSQTAAVVLLMFSSFVLYQLILKYQIPKDLNEWLNTKHDASIQSVLLQNELALYLSRRDDDELFWNVWNNVSQYVNDKLATLREGDEFPQEIKKILFRQRRVIGNSDETPSRFYLSDVITPLLYPISPNVYPHPVKHSVMWQLLNDVVVADNEEWILQHWSWMDNYYRFRLRNNDVNNPEIATHRDFVLVSCVMLGGLLLYHKRYSTINAVLFYTNVLPAEYFLIPNSLSEIANRISVIDGYKDHFMLLEANFGFVKLNNGVQNDSYIYSMAIRFLALCAIRLGSLRDYYQPTSDIPAVPRSYDEICHSIQIAKMLRQEVEEWYENNVFEKIEKLAEIPINEITDNLDKWIRELETTKADKEKHPKANPEKLNDFSQELIAASNRSWRKLPTKDDSLLPTGTDVEIESSVEFFRDVIDVKQFDADFNITSLNLPDILINILQRPTVGRYLALLDKNVIHEYQIQYRDVFTALDKLGVNQDFFIVNAGVYLGNYELMYGKIEKFNYTMEETTYSEAEIRSVDSNQMKLYVVDRKELPYIEYITSSPYSGLKPIASNTSLCSNMEEMLDKNNIQSDKFLMCLSRGLRMYSLKDGFSCLCLSITHNLSLGNLDIEKIS